MRILIVASFIPWPPTSGARIRTWEIARRLQTEHEVVFGLHVRSEEDLQRAEAIRQQGFQVIAGRVNGPLRMLPIAAFETLSGAPPLFALRRSHELETRLREAHAAVPFDVIQIEHFELARYRHLIGSAGKAVFSLVLHDLLSVSYFRMAAIEPRPWWRLWRRYNAMRFRRYERRLLPLYDACITVSPNDRTEVAGYVNPAKVHLLPNGVDCVAKPFLDENSGGPPVLLFVGLLLYPPNADAARWMALEILPRVRKGRPDCRLCIVGGGAPDDVRELRQPGVELTGEVEDLDSWYAQCDAAVAPIRAGGGTRLKILEAMAYGRPVISTAAGAEGLEVRHGLHLMLADTAEDFAAAILQVLSDAALRHRLRHSARELVESSYNWDDCARENSRMYKALRIV